MSDEEVIRALLVLARKLGVENRLVVAIQHGIGNREEVTEEQALCLAFGVHGAVRLCCTYGKDHPGMCSWERAIVGRSACIATSYFATTPGVTVHQCQRPSGHTGEHEATGADGVRWTWGDAPRDAAACTPHDCTDCDWRARCLLDGCAKARRGAKPQTPTEGCEAWEWGTNGHKAGCMLSAGHEGPHKGLDADGTSIFTWPCPCYPDCTGHAVGELCGAKTAAENPTMAGQVCALPRGHEGSHEATVNGQRWLFGAHDPSEPRA